MKSGQVVVSKEPNISNMAISEIVRGQRSTVFLWIDLPTPSVGQVTDKPQENARSCQLGVWGCYVVSGT